MFLNSYSSDHRHEWCHIRMCLFLFALLLRFDKKVILLVFYYCNLSAYDQNVTITAIGLQSTLYRQFGCLFSWYDVITCKSKRMIRWALSGTFFLKFSYFFMFLNIQIDLIILKTDDKQFMLATKKIIAYHL